MSRSDLSPIEIAVFDHLNNSFPNWEAISLVCGVSGGADSMCLLHILHKLEVEQYAVHVNYQKRGDQSDKDQALVENTADELNINCKVVTVEPDEAKGENFQQWARQVRYNAFRIKAEQIGADGIATAHHRDDQIETILQKIFRGAGLASWQAMQVWNGQLFRPLLEARRDEIENYCRENEIPYRDDASNFNSNFARNFLRNEWLPKLERHFPGWQQNVLRVSEQAGVFSSSLKYILADIADDRDRLNRKKFLHLDEDLQKSVLIYYVNRIDEAAEISRDALKELSKLHELQTGKSIQLTENLALMRDRDHLKLIVDEDDSDFFLRVEKEDLESRQIVFNGLKLQIQSYENPDFDRVLYLDVDALDWPVRFRRWRPADRFQPLGMEGHQSVADHLTNRKVGAAVKEKALVLESFEETICAVIFPPIENRVPPGTISEEVKCSPSTRTCLTIKHI